MCNCYTYKVVICNLIEMKYKLGTPKDLDSITKEDVLENKVWLWVWEAGLEDKYEEDWQVPIIGITNINQEFAEPIITLKIVKSNLIASASYNPEKNAVFGIAIWENEEWKMIKDCSLKVPIKFKSLVKINDKEGTEFELNSIENDEANII